MKRRIYYKCNIYDFKYEAEIGDYNRVVVVELYIELFGFKNKEKLPFMFNDSNKFLYYYMIKFNSAINKKIDYKSLVFNPISLYNDKSHEIIVCTTPDIKFDDKPIGFIKQYILKMNHFIGDIKFINLKPLSLNRSSILHLLIRISKQLHYSGAEFEKQYKNLSLAFDRSKLIEIK